MKFGYEIQRVKILQEYFRALIAGEKPFEIRKTDGMKIYEEGERLLLREIKEVVYFEECTKYDDCPYIEEVKNECEEYGEEEARDLCGKMRVQCGAHKLTHYTGRWCLVQIKKVFKLNKIGLPDYVAFTFDILEIGEDEEDEEDE